jgi:DNA-damage-inducible protein D
MSIRSQKVEPLKLWLASLGKQAIDETENPELLSERQAELYRAKGYTEEWIMRRVQTIKTRQNLRDHMTPMELILTALSEEVTRTITKDQDEQGFNENHDAAIIKVVKSADKRDGTSKKGRESQWFQAIIFWV